MYLNNWSTVGVSTSTKAEVLSICWSGAFSCVLTQCQRPQCQWLYSKRDYSLIHKSKTAANVPASKQIHPKVRETPELHLRLYRAQLVRMLNAELPDSKIRKTLNKFGLFRRSVRRNSPLSEKNKRGLSLSKAGSDQDSRRLEQCCSDRRAQSMSDVMHSAMFSEKQRHHISTNTMTWWFRPVLAPRGHSADHEILWISKYT